MATNPQIPVNLSIVNLFETVFGVKPSFAPDIEKLPARTEQNNYGTAYYGIDDFGREVFLPITFTYTDADGIKQDVVLHHAVIAADMPVSSVDTKMTERAGTFKEIISADDIQLDVVGFLISKDQRNLPEVKVRDLVRLRNNSTAVMSNALTDIYFKESGLDGSVMIKNITWPEVYGKQGVKPFRIRIVSDSIFNLTEIEE